MALLTMCEILFQKGLPRQWLGYSRIGVGVSREGEQWSGGAVVAAYQQNTQPGSISPWCLDQVCFRTK